MIIVRVVINPMNDDLAFIDAILADESDDTPRLVYADWLADHGEPELAALVRLQTEVYRTPSADPRRLDLRKQEAAAWNAYKKKWKAALELGRIGRGNFKRGVIPYPVEFTAPGFVEQCGGWGPGVPVRRVGLDRSGPRARVDGRLAACPFLARLTQLHIGRSDRHYYEFSVRTVSAADVQAVPSAAVLALARSPYITGLRELAISIVRPSRAMFADLAGCSALDRVSFSLSLVPYSGWGVGDWFALPLREFGKPAGSPIAEAVEKLLTGPNAEHLID
jgi:uncharacterized protein (TIGR02996 family)